MNVSIKYRDCDNPDHITNDDFTGKRENIPDKYRALVALLDTVDAPDSHVRLPGIGSVYHNYSFGAGGIRDVYYIYKKL